MNLTPIHDTAKGKLRCVGLMSGSGTNLRRILEHREALRTERGEAPYDVVAVFSDNKKSSAQEIAAEYDLPFIMRDIRSFYKKRGLKRMDLSNRPLFDAETLKALAPYEAHVAIYAGYMSVASELLIKAFLGINVHPGDLSQEIDGRRRWVGDHAVRDAILAGQSHISSSTHIVESQVDGGRLFMISAPLPVEIPPNADVYDPEGIKIIEAHNQARLKENGDWIIFPKTIEYIADGRFALDENGRMHFDGMPLPHGLRV